MRDDDVFDQEIMRYWDQSLGIEPGLPQEASVKLSLIRNDGDGSFDLVACMEDGSAVNLANMAECGKGWTVTNGGLYLSYGPKETLSSALATALQDGNVMRRIIGELTGFEDEIETEPLPNAVTELKNG